MKNLLIKITVVFSFLFLATFSLEKLEASLFVHTLVIALGAIYSLFEINNFYKK